MLVPKGCDLPPRCIICNQATDKPAKTRKIYWHTPWLYLLILLHILIYAVAALIVRKKIELSPALCPEHSKKRNRRLFVAVVLMITSVVAGVVLLDANSNLGAPIIVVGILASLLILIFTRLLVATKMTPEHSLVKGCKEPFLESLE